MLTIKCKMCGGTIEFETGATVGVCDSCGTKQTLPRLNDDRKANLYDRANHFRRNNEYDKAMSIYEQILNEDSTDAESYWSIVLCKYGIEYVEDPTTHKRVPTVNRAQFTSVVADEDYKKAIEYADISQKIIYEEEAATIDQIQKGILEISEKEEPFDVFICYKETDNNGRRTQDSVLANDLYHQLVQEGFKVFFSRITLEDKLGSAYEPYIFAALNSAKVMVVLGTKPEHFNAVWVKNEWSRYLSLIKKGDKKMLIPAYRDMDPYDLPEEFSHLQAQDMTKLGFMQDLIRGIKKIIGTDNRQEQKNTFIVAESGNNANALALIKRGNIALEDEDWEKANEFFDNALNVEAENSVAYLGLFLASKKVSSLDALFNRYSSNLSDSTIREYVAAQEEHIALMSDEYQIPGYLAREDIARKYQFELGYDSRYSNSVKEKSKALSELKSDRLLSRALQFANGETEHQISSFMDNLTRLYDDRIDKNEADDHSNKLRKEEEYRAFIDGVDEKIKQLSSGLMKKRAADYLNVVERFENAKTAEEFYGIEKEFKKFGDYQDAVRLSVESNDRAEKITKENHDKEEVLRRKKKKKITIIASLVVAIIVVVLSYGYYRENYDYKYLYNKATKLAINGEYEEAIQLFEKLGDYENSELSLTITRYNYGIDLMLSGDYSAALQMLRQTLGYADSREIIDSILAEAPLVSLDYHGTLSRGLVVVFGEYDGTPLEWIVADFDDDGVILVCKDYLPSGMMRFDRHDNSWRDSEIRIWLNDSFYDDAFSDDEKNLILPYSTGNELSDSDNVFLLSVDEAERYQDLFEPDGTGWWLRTAGDYSELNGTNDVAFVGGMGAIQIYTHGAAPKYPKMIRPAIRISF